MRNRWTEKDIATLKSKKEITTKAPEKLSKTIQKLVTDNEPSKKEIKSLKTKSVIQTRKEASNSTIEKSTISGHYEKGDYFEIKFTGAKLLSVNSLYSLSHFERISYKKTCHEAVRCAVMLIVGGLNKVIPFNSFEIGFHIQTQRLCDMDSVPGKMKYIIDGLTLAKIIADDGPEYFKNFSFIKQTKGDPFILIRVTNVVSN
jgi:hypothetical protein